MSSNSLEKLIFTIPSFKSMLRILVSLGRIDLNPFGILFSPSPPEIKTCSNSLIWLVGLLLLITISHRPK